MTFTCRQPPSDEEAEAYLRRAIARLPVRARRVVDWLRRSPLRWLRVLAALFVIIGGLLWFLPVLGFWMLPLGLLLLAEDIPPLKRRMVGILMCIERRMGRRTERDHPDRGR